MDTYYVPFTKEMAKDYTILIPTMLPMHFQMIACILRTYGYKIELLDTSGPEIAETGLKYVHNDTCYPGHSGHRPADAGPDLRQVRPP